MTFVSLEVKGCSDRSRMCETTWCETDGLGGMRDDQV